jgi:hypothetical protein
VRANVAHERARRTIEWGKGRRPAGKSSTAISTSGKVRGANVGQIVGSITNTVNGLVDTVLADVNHALADVNQLNLPVLGSI